MTITQKISKKNKAAAREKFQPKITKPPRLERAVFKTGIKKTKKPPFKGVRSLKFIKKHWPK